MPRQSASLLKKLSTSSFYGTMMMSSVSMAANTFMKTSKDFLSISAGMGAWLKGGTLYMDPRLNTRRKKAAAIIGSRGFKLLMGLAIVASAVLVVLETNIRAEGQKPESYMFGLDAALIAVYTAEIALRAYVHQQNFWTSDGNRIDTTIVVAELLVKAIRLSGEDTPSLSFVRILRLGRVLRIFRVVLIFRELYMMTLGLASAMKTILWATAMIAAALLVWAIIAVEYVQPLIRDMHANEGYFQGCDRCLNAFSSVQKAMLTFMQTIIAGDSWGLISIPVIERYPMTLFCFMPAFVSIQIGLMNLVLAVIVDRAHEARNQDVEMVLSEKAERFKKERARLLRLCLALDADNSGYITKMELLEGLDSFPEFADLLRYINVTKKELDMFFKILDVDGSGSISYKEFIEQLYMMKTQESKTFMVYNMHLVRAQLSDQLKEAESSIMQNLKHALNDQSTGQNTRTMQLVQADQSTILSTPMPSSTRIATKVCFEDSESGATAGWSHAAPDSKLAADDVAILRAEQFSEDCLRNTAVERKALTQTMVHAHLHSLEAPTTREGDAPGASGSQESSATAQISHVEVGDVERRDAGKDLAVDHVISISPLQVDSSSSDDIRYSCQEVRWIAQGTSASQILGAITTGDAPGQRGYAQNPAADSLQRVGGVVSM